MDKQQLIKHISGFAMGDGGVYYFGKNCRFLKNQKTEHLDFLEFQADVLSQVTEVTLADIKTRDDQKPHTRLLTRTNPLYTKVRKRLYTGNYKGLDPHYLKLLDWQTLAWYFMDDGWSSKDKRWKASVTVGLATDRLCYGDQLLLKSALKERLGLDWNINRKKDRYTLRLPSAHRARFYDGVSPFIFPSFEYKLIYPDVEPS